MYILCIGVCTGNTLNVQTGQWTNNVAGLGAGMDSFYEYLLKVNSTAKITYRLVYITHSVYSCSLI